MGQALYLYGGDIYFYFLFWISNSQTEARKADVEENMWVVAFFFFAGFFVVVVVVF